MKAIEPEHGSQAASLREQIEQHKNSDACKACHKSIDPYGFALENFDATGQWRTKYSAELPHRGTFTFRLQGYSEETSNIDAGGTIDGEEFADVFGLKRLITQKEQTVAYNFAKKFFEYANAIYQLPPFLLGWNVSRQEGKKIGKYLAETFDTIEKSASKSKRQRGVKPGKGRRSGGYGIG